MMNGKRTKNGNKGQFAEKCELQHSITPAPHRSTGRRGSVLVIALWTLAILGALAVAVGTYVQNAFQTAFWMKTGTSAHYLARAGMEAGIMEVVADTNGWDAFTESWSNDEDLFKEKEVGDGVYSLEYPCRGEAGCHEWEEGNKPEMHYGLMDEERRININKANQVLLSGLLQAVGNLDKASAGQLAAAIVDWRDEDDESLTQGAESGYYQALNQGYECHNDQFDSIHELKLVKGVSTGLFEAIRPHVTVFGGGKVNLNTAGPHVLHSVALAGGGGDQLACESLVSKILQFRRAGQAFEDASSVAIARTLNEGVQLQASETAVLYGMMKHISLKSSCFRGVALGRLEGRDVWDGRVEFVFNRRTKQVLHWRER